MLMRLWPLFIFVIAACDIFRSSSARPESDLTPEEFVEVYVALAKARTPAEKQQVLKQYKTSEKALQEFVQAYTHDLPELSAAFDSALARMSSRRTEGETEVPR
jgi:hypothetical protein